MTAPLVLLDVDGVLNVLPRTSSDLDVWPEWRSGRAMADGAVWPITWAPEVVRVLGDWHDSGRLEPQWLTTWGHWANETLRELVGLPALRVAGTYDDPDQGERAQLGAAPASHAEVAPSAPDPLSGRWWKYDIVRRVVAGEPGRRVIWIDDELYGGSPFREWAEAQPLLLPLGPHPSRGLEPAHLAAIERELG